MNASNKCHLNPLRYVHIQTANSKSKPIYTALVSYNKLNTKYDLPTHKSHFQEQDLLIEENGNDLIISPLNITNQKNAHTLTPEKTETHHKKKTQFEKDMIKCGLNDKIVHIETLNAKITNIIGTTEKCTSLGKMFPYQRRNRSSSPPKDSPLSNSNKRSNSPTPCKVMQLFSFNFVIASSIQQNTALLSNCAPIKEDVSSSEKLRSDSRNSTNQTDDDLKRVMPDDAENWMYKTWGRKIMSNEIPKDDMTMERLMGFIEKKA